MRPPHTCCCGGRPLESTKKAKAVPERISKLMRVSAMAILTAMSLALVAPVAMSDTSKSESEEATSAKASSEGAAATQAATEKPEEASTETQAGSSDDEALPDLAADTLDDPLKVTMGKDIWQQQCRHCHGRSAYPGKAPKLKPRKYKPEFVYDRITNGFRKMPPWKDVFSDEERVALVAWILSKKFSP